MSNTNNSNVIKNIIICFLAVLSLGLGGYITAIYHTQPTLVALWEPCVPDEETAIGIAQAIYKSKTGYELEKDAFKVYGGDDEWQVTLEQYVPEGKFLGCDTSGVYINKQDGTITQAWLSKKDVEEYLSWKGL